MATASPRRGVSMGDTSHHVSEEGLYFCTVLTVCRPKMKGNSDHLTNMSFIMKSLLHWNMGCTWHRGKPHYCGKFYVGDTLIFQIKFGKCFNCLQRKAGETE